MTAKEGERVKPPFLRGKMRRLRHQSVDEPRSRALRRQCLIGRARRCCKTGENHGNCEMHRGLFSRAAGCNALAEAPDKQRVPFRAVETDYINRSLALG